MQLSEKSNNILLLFYYIFVIYIKLWAFSVLKKKEPHSSNISRIIDSDRRGYLSVKKILFLKTLP